MHPTVQIHVIWKGPFTLDQAEDFQDEANDVGLYQVYGGHVAYGSDLLLYIGKAGRQPIGRRLRQEKWWRQHHDTDSIRVYVGRIRSVDGSPIADHEQTIDRAERLLIFSHSPAYNGQKNTVSDDAVLEHMHVFNWCNFRDLLPEVSGRRWADQNLGSFEEDQRREPVQIG